MPSEDESGADAVVAALLRERKGYQRGVSVVELEDRLHQWVSWANQWHHGSESASDDELRDLVTAATAARCATIKRTRR